MVRGSVEVNGEALGAGDGVAIDPGGGEETIVVGARDRGEVLLFDMAA